MTYDQYLLEPVDVVDWTYTFIGLENEMEHDANEKARREAESAH